MGEIEGPALTPSLSVLPQICGKNRGSQPNMGKFLSKEAPPPPAASAVDAEGLEVATFAMG